MVIISAMDARLATADLNGPSKTPTSYSINNNKVNISEKDL